MIKSGDGNGGDGFYYEPENYDSVIIWLHGKGDNARSYIDFINIAQNYEALRKTKIILPTASMVFLKSFGVLDNAWFDMENFTFNSIENIDDINNSVSRITNIICSELDKGINPSKISLGGFSQGAAIALLISMSSKKFTLGSCVVVSGWLPLIEKGFKKGKESQISTENINFEVTESIKDNVDFLVLHGEDDPVILYQWSLLNKEFILNHIKPKNFTYKSYSGVVHTITETMLFEIFSFFSKKLI